MSDDNLPVHRERENTTPGAYPAPTQPFNQISSPLAHPAPAAQPNPYAQSMPVAGYGYSQTMVARPIVGGVHIAIAWIFAVFSLGYFLPWAVAATRQKSNTLAIGLLNFFVGWTIIGWIASLVMACSTEPAVVNNVAYAVAPVIHTGAPATAAAGWYPDGSGGRRYWDGQRWTEHTAP